jgi:hypothetical protein
MKSQCIGCNLIFSGVSAFDAHRRDATDAELAEDSWMSRRCLTVAEMTARGWRQTAKGWWTNARPMPHDAISRVTVGARTPGLRKNVAA